MNLSLRLNNYLFVSALNCVSVAVHKEIIKMIKITFNLNGVSQSKTFVSRIAMRHYVLQHKLSQYEIAYSRFGF